MDMEETTVTPSKGSISDVLTFSGKKKAAILLVSIGNDAAGDIFKFLSAKEIDPLVPEIAKLGNFSNRIKLAVMQEFNEMLQAQEYINNGGIEYAHAILERSLGGARASEIINRLVYAKRSPFDMLKKADALQVFNFIQKEMPQTIALILSYLDPNTSAEVLSSLPVEKQAEVAKRIATMKQISPEMIRDVERVIERKMSALTGDDILMSGGIGSAVDILNVTERAVEKNIIESIEETDPELAEEIKNRMFVFEDIVLLDDRSIQRVLSEVDHNELAKALKGTSERVQEKLFSNMSSRAAEVAKEDMEYMGPIRLREVEEVQQKIVVIIRKLEEQGEIIISRGEQETFI